MHKVFRVVGSREGLVRNGLAEVLAQRSPAGAHAVLEQLAGWDKLANLLVVLVEPFLPRVLKVVVEEILPELAQHGMVQSSGPVEVRDSPELGVVGAPAHRLHDRSVPGVNVSCGDDNLGLGVGLDQFFGKRDGGPIADSLAVAEKSIPLLTAELAFAFELGRKGVHPAETIRRVLNTGGHHVVRVGVTQLFQGRS